MPILGLAPDKVGEFVGGCVVVGLSVQEAIKRWREGHPKEVEPHEPVATITRAEFEELEETVSEAKTEIVRAKEQIQRARQVNEDLLACFGLIHIVLNACRHDANLLAHLEGEIHDYLRTNEFPSRVFLNTTIDLFMNEARRGPEPPKGTK